MTTARYPSRHPATLLLATPGLPLLTATPLVYSLSTFSTFHDTYEFRLLLVIIRSCSFVEHAQ